MNAPRLCVASCSIPVRARNVNTYMHPNEKIFNCKDCKYSTNYLPNLKTHASSKHEKKVRQCSYCSYNTTWNTCFHKHMRSAHGLFQKKSKYSVESEAHPILCDDCGFSTFNQEQFNAHKLNGCQSQPILQYKSCNSSHMSYNPSSLRGAFRKKKRQNE